MTICPKCKQTYPDDFVLCPRDGVSLQRAEVWAQGSVIRDKYRVCEEIGSGGMATVYRAEHIRFREEVALKVINANFASDKVLAARFAQEAVITRKLNHPNIVRVEDIETAEDGRPFIVMELLRGTLLKEELKKAPFPIQRAVSIASQMAAGLQAAHDIGLVHRDIKPGNIMLKATADGREQVKILDFGIARVNEALLDAAHQGQTTLTGPGMVVGTPSYMSPEQAMGKRGDEIDGRADLYSLGAVTYQMLTGQSPIAGNSAMQLMLSRIEGEPTPIEQLRPELPKYLADAVMMCLAKDPNQRPKTCRDFAAALAEDTVAMTGTQPTPAPVQAAPSGKHRLTTLLAFAATVLICVGIAAIVARKRELVKPASTKTAKPQVSAATLPKTVVPIPGKADAKEVLPVPASHLPAPGMLKFGPQATGTQSAAQTVILSNNGSSGIAISDLKGNREFVVIGSACAGANCSVSVAFKPEDPGPRTGTLHLGGTKVEATGIGVANIEGSLYFVPQSLEVLSDTQAIERTKRKSAEMCPGYSERTEMQAVSEAAVDSLRVLLAHGLTLCPDRRLPENVGAVWNSHWGVFLWNPDKAKSVSALGNVVFERVRKEEFTDHSEVFGLDARPLKGVTVPMFKPRESYPSR